VGWVIECVWACVGVWGECESARVDVWVGMCGVWSREGVGRSGHGTAWLWSMCGWVWVCGVGKGQGK
jgi:hypothetical protein